ncbi:MAG: dTDP-4-dehydrorhamnose reductase [Ferruginibacter sp.]
MSQVKNILITGANGQVGMEFRKLAEKFPKYNFIFTTRNELQIGDEEAVNSFFKSTNISLCINCAAYTAVDLSELEREESMLINSEAVGYLAKASRDSNAIFIHLSTDYVFDGQSSSPYRTSDITSPVNFYGQTKLHGEEIALINNPDCLIIRTSWVYSEYGKNFVKTMLKLMSEKDSIKVVDDQFGSPTNASDLVNAIMEIISSDKIISGIYHYSNSGIISWFDFALEIKKLIGSSCIVNPIKTVEYPTPAKRPKWSALDTSKISETYGIKIADWKESLSRCELFAKSKASN